MLKRRFYAALFPVYRLLFPTRVPREARVPRTVKRVLVIRHDRLGDMILTTPVFDLLHSLAPGVEIDVLASPRNASLLDADDRVARVFLDDGTWRALPRLRRMLRARRYDAVFSLIPGRSIRQGWTAGIAAWPDTHRVSTWRPKRYHGFFTRVVRLPRSLQREHVSRQSSFVVRAAFGAERGLPDASVLAAPIRLAIPDDARREADAFIAAHALTTFVTVNLASTAPARSWTGDECARLLSILLVRHPGLSFVFVPGPTDVGEAEQVRASLGSERVVTFDPNASLLTVAALVSRSVLMVTPDTMTLHLAVATQRPVLSLHTMTDGNLPDLWKAVGVPSRALVAPRGSPVAAISAEQVAEAFEELAREAALSLPRA